MKNLICARRLIKLIFKNQFMTMRALVYSAPQMMRLETRPSPSCVSDDEVLLSVAAAGICGSDMHAFLGHDARRPPPLILGHEAAGYADNGQAFIVNPLVVCGQCSYCLEGRDNLCWRRQIISMPPREGAFAEKLIIPRGNVLPLPNNLSVQQGALAEPLACGYHVMTLAERHNRQPLSECRAVIFGGGAIGLAAALSLSAKGVKEIHIVETNKKRYAALKGAGDFAVIAPEALDENCAQIVIDAVGSKASRDMAGAVVQAGGVVAHIGLAEATGGFDKRRMTLQEIVLCGAYTYTAESFAKTVEWMAAGKLGALDWFETRPLKEGAQAFADLLAGKVEKPKILLMM